MCIHVKYMCYTLESGLVVFATPKNPHFDPSLISEWQVNQKLQLMILSLKPREYM